MCDGFVLFGTLYTFCTPVFHLCTLPARPVRTGFSTFVVRIMKTRKK